MPYNINRYKDGYRVCKPHGVSCFSKHPLSYDTAKKQRIALYISERRKHGGQLWRYDPELYNHVKDEVTHEFPIHSLARQANIHDLYHEMLSGGQLETNLVKQLTELGITSTDYLYEAKQRAKKAGYDPNLLTYANDNKHKLQYESPHGVRRFGGVGYRDHIMWESLEHHHKVPRGTAAEKRRVFRNSHEKISEIHHLDRYSPNALALSILW
jgi:hypothetical protein